MKKLYLVSLFSVFVFSGFSQCMLVPLSLEERTEHSDLIAEGKILSSRTVLSNNKGNIYTIYLMQPLAVFKGSISAEPIQISVQGGELGDRGEIVTNTPNIFPGQIAMFQLIHSNDPVSNEGKLYEVYGGPQGVLNYDVRNGSAAAVFDTYQSVINELRPAIVARTNQFSRLAVPQADEMFTTASQNNFIGGSSFTAAVTGFSPATITAGTQSLLTITGSSFGATQGTSTVEFRNANSGGATYVTPLASQYVLWSDNQIQVYVPSGSGTGTFNVVISGVAQASASALTVSYNITNFNSGGVRYFPSLINDNSRNGYTWQYFTDFAALTGTAVQYFETPRDQWICSSGVNWQTGAVTTTDAATFDGMNIVRFDNGSELSAGVLGQAGSYYSNCGGGRFVNEVDLSFDDGTTFYYGTGAGGTFPNQIDFHTVALHELGHAHQIGHIIDNNATMHYSLGANQARRVLSPGSDQPAADWALANSVATCGISVMLPLSCSSQAVTLGGGSTSIGETGGTTTITSSIPARYYRAVTADLGFTGTATSGTDYSATATSLTTPIGLLAPETVVTINTIGDAAIEGNETIIAEITSVTNGAENGVQTRTITIVDDDLVSSNVNGIRATSKNCRVALAYTYLGSADASELILERSKDEITWEKLQSINAAGIAGSEQSINWNDNFPVKGTNFYRVRRVYANSEVVSNIGRALQTCNTPISITPNPAQDFIMLQGVSGIYNAAVFTAEGKNILTLQNVSGTLRIDIKSIAAGRYFVRVQSNEGLAETLNFIKQ